MILIKVEVYEIIILCNSSRMILIQVEVNEIQVEVNEMILIQVSYCTPVVVTKHLYTNFPKLYIKF